MGYRLGLDYLYEMAKVKETAAEPLLMVAITERLEAIAAALERIAMNPASPRSSLQQEWLNRQFKEENDRPYEATHHTAP